MRNSKYITKYDYIGYYTKQVAMWFFSNAEIKTKIDLMMQKIKENDFDQEEFEEEDELEEDSFDAVEWLKEIRLTNSFKDAVNENRDIDKNNPKIAEGIILDEKSQQAIIDKYKHIKKIINFDIEYTYKTIDEQFDITIDLIENNQNLILFQPTFIINGLVTKPDAFVRDKENIFIIETKGTSSIKKHHILDIFYQSKVVENAIISKINQIQFNYQYFFCIVDYIKLKKNEVSFRIIDTVNYKKTPTALDRKSQVFFNQKEIEFIKRKYKAAEFVYILTDENKEKYIDHAQEFKTRGLIASEIIKKNFSSIDAAKVSHAKENGDPNTRFNTTIDDYKKLMIKTIDEFEFVISELKKHQKTLIDDKIKSIIPNDFKPSNKDKGEWKDNDFWNDLRVLYYLMGYDPFSFSGKIFKVKEFGIDRIHKNTSSLEVMQSIFSKDNTKEMDFASAHMYNVFKKEEVVIFQKAVEEFKKLKPKKVYFDFESINTAIRVVDDSYPFMQIITQNSIIIDDSSTPIKDLKCKNMIIDPQDVNVNWFKDIIDSLYCGSDYSYVVYNESFEKTRLIEMANFINEDEYYNKVRIINENVYDLAKLFTISKSSQLIVFPELKGFYSIKKVLPLIQRDDPKIYLEVGCKNYKELDVSNGLICQNLTTLQFFKKLSIQEWKKFMNDASVYCENDVRAMVAVEYYVKKIINEFQSKNKISANPSFFK